MAYEINREVGVRDDSTSPRHNLVFRDFFLNLRFASFIFVFEDRDCKAHGIQEQSTTTRRNKHMQQDNAQQLPRSGSNRCVVVAVVLEDVVAFVLVVVVVVAVF